MVTMTSANVRQDVSIQDLLEAGLHFGHRTKRWNPKMRKFLFGQKNGIYIIDLVQTLQALQTWGVSLIAQTGLTFDLVTPHGKMIASVMASLAEFERDLIRERVKSGLEAARARGKRLGRQPGQSSGRNGRRSR